jgi:hypothetical protein
MRATIHLYLASLPYYESAEAFLSLPPAMPESAKTWGSHAKAPQIEASKSDAVAFLDLGRRDGGGDQPACTTRSPPTPHLSGHLHSEALHADTDAA